LNYPSYRTARGRQTTSPSEYISNISILFSYLGGGGGGQHTGLRLSSFPHIGYPSSNTMRTNRYAIVESASD